MHVAVATENSSDVTSHLGRCKLLWVFEVQGGRVVRSKLLNLGSDCSGSHDESTKGSCHPELRRALQACDAVICGGAGPGLAAGIIAQGTSIYFTEETDRDKAIEKFLGGKLSPASKGRCGHAQSRGSCHGSPPSK